ncbi:DUF5316 family protein [Alicyclobacillus fodiniaquatilis]|uniref:DUF5316 family protein n=1 Tax=Alicyclobacillus fodiniaquatilis TaxID=1661150 RepID=A0ABW4JCP5_9BACL
MKSKIFISGLGVAIIGIILGLFIQTEKFIQDFSMFSAGIPLLISAILVGTFVSGDRTRANSYNEHSEDRNLRLTWALALLIFAIPSIMLFILTYLMPNFK